MRRHHDMGGLDAGPVEQTAHDYLPWEKKVDALVRLAGGAERKMIAISELRRSIEDLGPGAYDEMSYYERWISGFTNLMIEKGFITVDELGRKMEEVKGRWREAAK